MALTGSLARGLKQALLCSIMLLPAEAQFSVLTNRYDNGRTGANTSETILNSSNVNVKNFGKVATISVDGSVYAQPLYVPNLAIPGGGTRNVLFVATMNDKVYGFDADTYARLWFTDFTNAAAGVTAIPIADVAQGQTGLNISGNVGVESTPVIDAISGTMYVVARTKENGSYVQKLHALDIITGNDKVSPVVIQASVPGTGYDSVSGKIEFNPKTENQRTSLALVGGRVLIAWASHEDFDPYHGWIMAYDAATLAQVNVFCTTPNGSKGGLWNGGRAPVIDAGGNVYFATGNADWNGTKEWGDSVLKFSPGTSGLSVTDYFTPSDWLQLEQADHDLGSSGPLLIPNTNLLVAGGKEGVLYVLSAGNLGHEAAGNTQIVQTMNLNGGQIKPGPAYWNSPAGGLLYIWAEADVLKAFHFNGSTLDTPAFAQGSVVSPGSPGGSLTVSANGSSSGTGVVWAQLSKSSDADHGLHSGILHAFNAETLQEIWNSEQLASRDRLGTLTKFVPPLVVNGKAFATTYDNAIAVYGLVLAPSPDFVMTVNPASQTVAPSASANFSVNVSAAGGFAGSVNLSVSGLPSGANSSFTPTSVSGSGNSVLQIATANTTPPGPYNLTISGGSGSLSHTATVNLTVSNGSSPSPAVISINFVGKGVSMAATETAGVVPKTNWNNAANNSNSVPRALVNELGSNSGATLTWHADNSWSVPITASRGNVDMMKGYLDNDQTNPTKITVASLPNDLNGFDIYVYADGDNGTASRSASYQLSGAGITTQSIGLTDAKSTNFRGNFIPANNSSGNYVKFTIGAVSGFVLTATPGAASSSTRRAPVNGIQIVPR